MIRLIVALDDKRGVAKHSVMPWYIPEDEQYFTDQTKSLGGRVLSGRGTFDTYNGPLQDRQNFVLTHDPMPIKGVEVVHDLKAFLDQQTEDLWVAGGAAVFAQTIARADELYVTEIAADFGCDKFFPEYKTDFTLVEQGPEREQNGFHFRYCLYKKPKPTL